MAGIDEDFEYMSEEDFDYGSEMYMFEPEYTDEELRLRQEARVELAATQMGDEENPQRTESLFWCKCGHCELKPLAVECLCCKDWAEWRWRPDESDDEGEEEENSNADGTTAGRSCISERDDLGQILQRAVLELFFLTPRINWDKRPTPEGENGHLSAEQCRLASYRIALEWGLRGETLGKNNRVVLPSCLVSKIRSFYPSPSGLYRGFLEEAGDINHGF